jgi:hypothetical protein
MTVSAVQTNGVSVKQELLNIKYQNLDKHFAIFTKPHRQIRKSNLQGDSYSFINILTSGRFRSEKALDNKI